MVPTKHTKPIHFTGDYDYRRFLYSFHCSLHFPKQAYMDFMIRAKNHLTKIGQKHILG